MSGQQAHQKSGGLARTNQSALAQSSGEGEITQLLMHGGNVLDGQHEYQIGEDTFIAKPIVCTLDKDDFVEIKSGYGENQKISYSLKVDGKKKIMNLAGVQQSGRFTERLGAGNRDVCEYEAAGEWTAPNGLVVGETRVRRIDLKEIERQQTMQKMKNTLKEWEDGRWEGYRDNRKKVPPTADDKQKLSAFKEALVKKISEGMETEEAIYSLRATVLSMSDILQILQNVADMREHLLAIAQSKAQSQLGTAMMRSFGGKWQLTQAPGDCIKVCLVNTVKVPAAIPGAVNLLYGDETVVTAEGEEVKAEDIETSAVVQEIKEAEDVETPPVVDDSVIDAVLVEQPEEQPQTITTGGGQTVDTGTGEILPEAPKERDTLIAEIKAQMTELKLDTAGRVRLLVERTGKGKVNELSDEQLVQVLGYLNELKEGDK